MTDTLTDDTERTEPQGRTMLQHVADMMATIGLECRPMLIIGLDDRHDCARYLPDLLALHPDVPHMFVTATGSTILSLVSDSTVRLSVHVPTDMVVDTVDRVVDGVDGPRPLTRDEIIARCVETAAF